MSEEKMSEEKKSVLPEGAVRTALHRGRCPEVPRLAARYLEEYREKIRRAVSGLDDEALWSAPPGANPIGNLLLHLAGNLRLWVLAGLGGRDIARDRAGEFTGGPDARALERLEDVVDDAVAVLRGLSTEALSEPVDVQGYAVDRLGALVHATEHFSYHTGQIVLLAKIARGERHGLEFYPQHGGE